MSAKMTNQSHATDICRTVDEGAIYELSFIFRWHKPAEAYRLTKGMAEVVDYTDGTFHKVMVRETGEILLTREFKRTYKEKYAKPTYKGNRNVGAVRYSQYVGLINEVHVHHNYKFCWYLTQQQDNKIKVTATLRTDKELSIVLDLTLDYSEYNYYTLLTFLRWVTDQEITYVIDKRYYNDNYKFKPAVLKFFNS